MSGDSLRGRSERQDLLQVLGVLLDVEALALAAVEPDRAHQKHRKRQRYGEPTACPQASTLISASLDGSLPHSIVPVDSRAGRSAESTLQSSAL